MEADYGISIFDGNNDDDDQREYYKQQYAPPVVAEPDAAEGYINEEEDDDNTYINCASSGMPLHGTKRTHEVFSMSQKKTKKKRKGNLDVEEFYKVMFQSQHGQLPGGDFPAAFANKMTYFDELKACVLEETRASVAQSLSTCEGQLRLQLSAAVDDAAGLVLLDFIVLSENSRDLSLPGCYLSLSLLTSGGHRNQHVHCLAAVAQGSRSMGIAKNNRLPLWIAAQSPVATHLRSSKAINNIAPVSGSIYRFDAIAHGSVLSYQRMMSACCAAPSPPFLDKLLSRQPATHVKFDDDGDIDTNATGMGAGARSEADRAANLLKTSSAEHLANVPAAREQVVAALPLGGSAAAQVAARRQAAALNDSQLVAVHEIASDLGAGLGTGGALRLVQGPPGTGKTHFLVALLQVVLSLRIWAPAAADGNGEEGRRDGTQPVRRVMVCAPSNKAVCVALDKFLAAAGADVRQAEEGHGARGAARTRVALVGVRDKLDPTSEAAMDVAAPAVVRSEATVLPVLPVLPAALVDLLSRLSRPAGAADVYVYTYASRVAAALRGAAEFCNGVAQAVHRRKVPPIDAARGVEALQRLLTDVVAAVEVDAEQWYRVSAMQLWAKVEAALAAAAAALPEASPSGVATASAEGEGFTRVSASLNALAAAFSAHDADNALTEGRLRTADVVFCTLASAGSGVVKRVRGGTGSPMDMPCPV